MTVKKRLSSGEAQDRIILAAARAFRAHGTGTTVEQIAAEANYSTSALYKHFANRDAILEALGERAHGKMFALFCEEPPGEMNFEQHLRWLVHRIMEFALADSDFYLAVLSAAPAIRASGDPRRFAREQQHLNFFKGLMEQGIADGAMCPQFSPLQLALAFRSMLDSVGAMWVQSPDADLKKMATDALDLLLYGAVKRS